MMRRIATSALLCTALANVVQARGYVQGGPIAGYVPRVWPIVIFTVLYAIAASLLWYQWRRMGKQRYMLALTIGMSTMTLGLIFRGIYHQYSTSLTIYIITTLFVLLSPCAFLANNYVLVSRLAVSLGEDIASSCLFISSRLIVKIFVTSDICTFLLQATGGAMSTAQSVKVVETGNHIALAALILQMCSYILFLVVLISFVIRVRSKYPEAYFRASNAKFPSLRPISFKSTAPIADWRLLFFTMLLTSVGIVIRSCFRVAEFSGGYYSYLATTEVFLYCLDILPLLLAMSCYIFVWPPRLVLTADKLAEAGIQGGKGSPATTTMSAGNTASEMRQMSQQETKDESIV